jgi:hypothetical protein
MNDTKDREYIYILYLSCTDTDTDTDIDAPMIELPNSKLSIYNTLKNFAVSVAYLLSHGLT